MVGELDRSGIGTPLTVENIKSLDKLWHVCEARNAALVKSLRVDPHADELLAMARADAKLHRVSAPVPIEEFDTTSCLLHPRFMVEQPKPNGAVKLRPIDHFSWSLEGGKSDSVNGHVAPTEKLKHDTLDRLEALLRVVVQEMGQPPALIKLDIDAAFRRVPVDPSQRWVCGCTFRAEDKVGSNVALCCCTCVWSGRYIEPSTMPACLGPSALSTHGNA